MDLGGYQSSEAEIEDWTYVKWHQELRGRKGNDMSLFSCIEKTMHPWPRTGQLFSVIIYYCLCSCGDAGVIYASALIQRKTTSSTISNIVSRVGKLLARRLKIGNVQDKSLS